MNMQLIRLNIKQAIRNLLKNGWQTILSVFGLVLGLVCLSYSLNWIWNELHHDSFRRGYEDVYCVQARMYDDSLKMVSGGEATSYFSGVSIPVFEEAKKRIPEGTDCSLIVSAWNTKLTGETGEELEYKEIAGVDSVFADILDIRSVLGDAKRALSMPDQLVMTRSRAIALFGSEEKAMGQRLHLEGRYVFAGNRTYVVSAVIEDNREMTNIELDLLVGNFNVVAEPDRTYAGNFNYRAIVRTKDPEAVEKAWETMRFDELGSGFRMGLVPLRIYHILAYAAPSQLWNQLIYPVAFAGVSLLLLLSAFFNYIAILTSIFLGRVREYSLRISMGSTYRNNVIWLVTEVGITLLIVLFLSCLALEWINFLADIPEASIGVFSSLALCMAVFVVLMLLGVCYPLNRLRRIYKSQFGGHPAPRHITNSLLLLQLAVCFLLVFALAGSYRQLHMIFTADLGFCTENILRIKTLGAGSAYRPYGSNFFAIEERLNDGSNPAIVKALAMHSDLFESSGRTTNSGNTFGIDERPYSEREVRMLTLPYETKDFFQLKMLEGEWFKQPVDVINEQPALLNPEAVEALHLQDYATRTLKAQSNTFWDTELNRWNTKVVPLRISGVVSFRTKSLHQVQEPLLIYCSPDGRTNHGGQWNHNAIYVKHKPGQEAGARQEIVKVLKEFGLSDEAIEITRMSDHVLKFYEKEQNYLNVFTVIVLGSVLITLFGVLSMILYVLRLQRRNIAIRRVFGATFGDICRQYLRSYLGYTVLGCVLAYPVGKMVMDWWLEGYDVRVSVGWLQGLAVFVLMLLLVASVVIVQIYRVTRENPANVVKSE